VRAIRGRVRDVLIGSSSGVPRKTAQLYAPAG
jgi:hypothetical protein